MVISKKNPIIPGRGVCDPHGRIFNGELYIYASHDAQPNGQTYCMHDWEIWKSPDAVHWTHAGTVRPEDCFMGASNDCWATDAVERNGKYYFYFSDGNRSIGVLRGDSPEGPFEDPLGRPLIAQGSTPTMEYDPHILIDDDEGHTPYIVFGGPKWAYGDQADGYYIARLAENMIELAETPRKLQVNHRGDDKAALHKWNGKYYLTWASHFAVSDSVYGPYEYRGNIAASKDHGSFFFWNNQWFKSFTVFDPTCYHRASGLTYVHYQENGDLANAESLIVEYGVGHYDARWNRISAAWYMKASRYCVREGRNGGFETVNLSEGDFLDFPNVEHMPENPGIAILGGCTEKDGAIEIWSDGQLAGVCKVPSVENQEYQFVYTAPLTLAAGKHDLQLRIAGKGSCMRIDSFRIYERQEG